MEIVLSIVPWSARFSGGQHAEHYYGKLRFADQVVELNHEIATNDPSYQDCLLWRRFYKLPTYSTIQFATKNDVVKAAREWMWDNARPADLLKIIVLTQATFFR